MLRNERSVSPRVRNAIHHRAATNATAHRRWRVPLSRHRNLCRGSIVNDLPLRATCCWTNQIIVFPSADEASLGRRLKVTGVERNREALRGWYRCCLSQCLLVERHNPRKQDGSNVEYSRSMADYSPTSIRRIRKYPSPLIYVVPFTRDLSFT